MEEELGVIGEIIEDDFPVIYSFIKELPDLSVISKYPTLVVISWKYDGSMHNGYPDQKSKDMMYKLEDLLGELEDKDVSFRSYGRTGNNLKELAYYTSTQEYFLEKVNVVLMDLPRFPIDITFYQDENWTDYKELLADFKYC
jgi:hypothetical protein